VTVGEDILNLSDIQLRDTDVYAPQDDPASREFVAELYWHFRCPRFLYLEMQFALGDPRQSPRSWGCLPGRPRPRRQREKSPITSPARGRPGAATLTDCARASTSYKLLVFIHYLLLLGVLRMSVHFGNSKKKI
jgi:hypothetical protein